MFDFLTHINLPPYLLFIVIIFGILVYYFHKDISKLIGKKEVKEDIKDLKSHDVFSTLERVKQEVAHMKFYSHGSYDSVKSRMCSDFAKFKCNVCTDYFTNFLDKDIENVSFDELKQLILKEMYAMHNDYIKQIRNNWLDNGIDKNDVNYVIELFEKFRSDVVMGFHRRIDSVFACTHYRTNFEKVLACYDVFAFGIDLLPKDMQDTFENLNGKFANINYN
jgi:hypothetical protein